MCEDNCNQIAGVLSRTFHVPFPDAKNQLDMEAANVLSQLKQERRL